LEAFLGLDERLVEAARGTVVGQNLRRQLHGREIGVRPRRHVIADHDVLHLADSAQRDRALAVLRRLVRVDRRQRALRLWNRCEQLADEAKGLGFVDLARHDEDGVVRLVVRPVERLQASDRNVLDVGARPDRGLAVVVPQIRGGEDALVEDAKRIVLAASNSLRTTVISLSRSFFAMNELTIRSDSRSSAHSRLSSMAEKVSK
jgi:hypothetical protein